MQKFAFTKGGYVYDDQSYSDFIGKTLGDKYNFFNLSTFVGSFL